MALEVGPLRFTALADGPEDGELVLLLHGFPQSAATWSRQLPVLARAGFRAVAPDQRGYSPGARPSGVHAYDVDLLVGDVVGMADSLGADRFHLVGHDWGGIVAWHAAATIAHRLRSLTVVSTPHPTAWSTALADPGSDQTQRSSYIEGFKQPGSADAWLADDAAFLRLAFEASGLAGHDVSRHVQVLTEPGALDAALDWYRAYDFRGATLDDVTVPTLYVWSTEDPALGRTAAELTGRHVTGPYRFEVLEGAPHWIPEAAADRFDPLLLQHLEANRS